MKLLLGLLFLSFSIIVQADILKDFDSLGGNDVLLDKVNALRANKKIKIVQKRIVSRENRHEFFTEAYNTIGGDAYVDTKQLAFNYQYHINPRYSVGFKYSMANNELTKEADYLIEGYDQVPVIDWQKDSVMAVFNYYPIYGKFNFLDSAIVHFDIYGILSAGKVNVRSGSKNTYATGAGMGFWWSQHLTSRFEVRYHTFEAERFNTKENMNLVEASISIGYLL